MRHILGTVVIAAGVIGSAAAGAEDFYVGLNGGLNLAGDMDVDGTGIDQTVNLDSGSDLAASVGYAFGNGLRAEAEVSWRHNGVDDVSGTAGSGEVNSVSGMINGLYDFDTETAFTPYLGVGAGAMRVGADGIDPVSGSRIDDHDIAVAVQGIAGLSYKVDDRWSVNADYQRIATPSLSFRTDSGVDVDSDYSAHTFRIGLRFAFGGPERKESSEDNALMMHAAAPADGNGQAAAAPEETPEAASEPRRFTVLFDWDSATLKPEGKDAIRQAAEQAKAGETVRIETTGHADRSGPEKYNMDLSKRRALAVRTELVAQGVSGDQIELAWKGETDPRVPTPDGKREPRNRRVEIVLP